MSAEPLTLRLFGPMEARRGDRPLPPLRTRKGYWILALLAFRPGREVERDWLAGTLWPDSSQAQAYASLRRTLTDLRRALGDAAGCLSAPRPSTLRLDPDIAAQTDVSRFDDAMRRGDFHNLQRAVALYRGPLLEGCTEEWAISERTMREREMMRALELLAAHAGETGDHGAAIGYLCRLTAVDPHRESAHRTLMESYRATGDDAAAIQTYRNLRVLLRRDLNVEPSPSTKAVFDSLRLSEKHTFTGVSISPPHPSLFSPLSSALPRPLTRLIGREPEIRQIRAALETARVVTLIGAGGVGKTRLALQVAEEERSEANEVAFVELAPVSDATRLPEAVLAALGIPERAAGCTPIQALQEALETRSLLLLLDNCEHLSGPCANIIARLTRSCPRLRVLATSRQSLGLTGEIGFRVSPLALPALSEGEHGGEDWAALADAPAVALFLERASATRPGFALTPHNADAILHICRQLDGLPLALELAAPWLRSLSPDQLAERLWSRWDFPGGKNPMAWPHQQTLRATMDWSYSLLSEPERRLLQALSVFSGGWTLEAAEALCPEEEVLNLLSRLVDGSLVQALDIGEGRIRYGMLETVRQYSREQGMKNEEYPRWRQRHAEGCFRLVEEAETRFRRADQLFWFTRLREEHENCRAALEWHLSSSSGAESALRMAGSLSWYWSLRGHLHEGREGLEKALEVAADAPARFRARALEGRGRLAWHMGDHDAARSSMEEAITLSRNVGEGSKLASALHNLGWVSFHLGDLPQSEACHKESLALYRELDHPAEQGDSLICLAACAFRRGHDSHAERLLTEGRALYEQIGDRFGLSLALLRLGEIAAAKGDHGAAQIYYMEGLALRLELGYPAGIAQALDSLGRNAMDQGDSASARRHYGESLAVRRKLGGRGHLLRSLEHFAELFAAESKWREAARLCGVIGRLSETLAVPPPSDAVSSVRESARAALGEEIFAWEEANGHCQSLESVMDALCAEPTERSGLDRAA